MDDVLFCKALVTRAAIRSPPNTHADAKIEFRFYVPPPVGWSLAAAVTGSGGTWGQKIRPPLSGKWRPRSPWEAARKRGNRNGGSVGVAIKALRLSFYLRGEAGGRRRTADKSNEFDPVHQPGHLLEG